MDIGIPRETKPHEGRAGLMPVEVGQLTAAGHAVRVETGAGELSGASDADYAQAGAVIVETAQAAFGAEMIVRVKEFLATEYELLEPRHTVFTNLHTALDRPLADRLLEVGLTAIAAEDTHEHGSPNCPLAGEVGALEGVRLCLAPHGGTGRHLFAHFGAPAIRALVIGLGAVGQGALRTLMGLGVDVAGFDISPRARMQSELAWGAKGFRAHDVDALAGHLADADMIVNCVLWPKHRDDHLVSRTMLAGLKPAAVIVDISCDEAGAIETSRPTTWADPVYQVDGIRHFAVDNVPGAVPVAASAGYSRAILHFVSLIAEKGALAACREQPWLARGLVCAGGTLVHAETARVQDRPHTPVEKFLDAPA